MSRRKSQTPIERWTVCTQRDVARRMGISAMRVSQLERSALQKLRVAFREIQVETREQRTEQHALIQALNRLEREQWAWHILNFDLAEPDWRNP